MSSGIFDYMQVITVGAQLEVDEVGDCCILGRDDLGQEYYLVIKTHMGCTNIVEYGPAVPDLELLPKKVTYKFDREDYNENKLSKRIEKFLVSYPITYAECVELEDIHEFIRAPIEYMEVLKL